MTIERDLGAHARESAGKFPVVAVTGPRQSGKTTLCRAVFPNHPYVSLEDPSIREAATRDARGFLARFPDGAVLDEIQRVPDLTSYLQVLVDQDSRPGRWILAGSQHFQLTRSISQSLVGRIAWLELLPLSWAELQRFPNAPRALDEVLFAGGYPRIHDRGIPVEEWFREYVALYLERDVRDLKAVGDLLSFQRFVKLAAGRSAQLVNLSSLGADAGIVHATARAWLSVLETSYVAFQIAPISRNVRKRLIRSPKLHLYDSGLHCYLLDIRSPEQLAFHPLRGAILESWVVAEVLKQHAHHGQRARLGFYRDQRTEVDLVVEHGSTMIAAEVKSGMTVQSEFSSSLEALRSTMARAPERPRVEKVVVYGGSERHPREGVEVLPWSAIAQYDWVRSSRSGPG